MLQRDYKANKGRQVMKNKDSRLTIRLNSGLREELKQIAEEKDVSEATIARWALKSYMTGE